MYFYAQLNEDSICSSVSDLATKHDSPNMIPINDYDTSLLGMLWNGNEFVPPPIVEVWVISSLMFRNRFTFQERVNITNSAKTDTVVEVFASDLNANPNVNLQGEETVYAVNYLADIDVIAKDRVDVILAPAYQQDGQWVDPPVTE